MTAAGPEQGLFNLTGRAAFVTGAAPGGLGEQMARALAAAGARVALLDLPQWGAQLADLATDLPDVDGGHFAATCDVSDEAAVEAAVAAAVGELGEVHFLVNAAGVMLRKPTLETSLAEWHRVLDVNLTGTWLMSRAVARRMLDAGFGRIVNISSLYTNIVGPLPEAPYYASKGGVAQLTRALAGEWSPAGINVNCIAPGVFFPTSMTEPLREQPNVLDRMRARTFVGRLGDPVTDIGGVAVFLCSRAAAYITGQVIFVDGGWSAW